MRAIIGVQREHGSFGDYLWAIATSVEDGNEAAAVMSAQLRKAGFKFVGVTICHSFMQASGMRNDHARDCFRYDEIESLRSA
jgi:DNA-3-methyladenine glycosylase I